MTYIHVQVVNPFGHYMDILYVHINSLCVYKTPFVICRGSKWTFIELYRGPFNTYNLTSNSSTSCVRMTVVAIQAESPFPVDRKQDGRAEGLQFREANYVEVDLAGFPNRTPLTLSDIDRVRWGYTGARVSSLFVGL